jgi:NADH-quinone oxidoreductase subunit L
MAGPTPVSALIHAATMVTAGVYMIARLHGLYALAPARAAVVAVIGTATALLARVIATAQTDIKKVLAYSTISQLGYMFLGLGVGASGAAIFHLVTHAFFKALLFLGAGSVITGSAASRTCAAWAASAGRCGRRSRRWRWGRSRSPACHRSPASSARTRSSGARSPARSRSPVLGVLAFVAAFLTAYYTGRLFFMTFFGAPRGEHHAHESPPVMTLPLIVLAILALVGGFIPVPAIVGHVEAEHAPVWMFALASAVALAGLALAWHLYVQRPERPAEIARRLGASTRSCATASSSTRSTTRPSCAASSPPPT